MNFKISVFSLSLFSLSLLLIFFCFLFFSSLYNGVWSLSEGWSSVFSLKCCVILSLFSLLLFHLLGKVSITLDWFFFGPKGGVVSVLLDKYFLLFFFVGSFVTWSILEFSIYYMNEDPYSKSFFRLLLIFLLNMFILTCSDSLFVFFIGWEGVGFLSFMLIGWWKTRIDTQGASLQAVLYNRVGDLGVIFMVFFSLAVCKSWCFSEAFFYNSSEDMLLLLFFGLLAAIGKSSQFGFHPWLPAAMEGPTPVSALLHSSTMVVAGVFLLIRITTLSSCSFFLSCCLFMGSLTSIFAASTACFQYDFKKIVAYSTTSQLGLMVGSIGLGLPLFAFFHICTHAFFKALLFLCSGSVIHNYKKEQDIRKVGNLSSSLPMSFSCFLMSSVSLSGIPFFSGFYSKDIMLEGLSSSVFSGFGVVLLSLSTIFTAFYSSRLVYFCLGGGSFLSISSSSEENFNLILPMVRLLFGVFFFGFIFGKSLDLEFLLPSAIFKGVPLFFTLLGFCFGVLLFCKESTVYNKSISFFSGQWFFIFMFHRGLSFFSQSFSLLMSLFDRLVLSLGPESGGSVAVFFTRNYTRIFHQWKMSGQLTILFLLVLPYSSLLNVFSI